MKCRIYQYEKTAIRTTSASVWPSAPTHVHRLRFAYSVVGPQNLFQRDLADLQNLLEHRYWGCFLVYSAFSGRGLRLVFLNLPLLFRRPWRSVFVIAKIKLFTRILPRELLYLGLGMKNRQFGIAPSPGS